MPASSCGSIAVEGEMTPAQLPLIFLSAEIPMIEPPAGWRSESLGGHAHLEGDATSGLSQRQRRQVTPSRCISMALHPEWIQRRRFRRFQCLPFTPMKAAPARGGRLGKPLPHARQALIRRQQRACAGLTAGCFLLLAAKHYSSRWFSTARS